MPAKSEYYKLCELMLKYKTDRGEVLKKIGYVYNYAVFFRLIKTSDLNEDRSVAHEKNVKQYMIS